MNLDNLKEKLSSEVIKLGYDFVSLNFSYRDKERILTLTIDRVEPISLNDIVAVNDVLSPLLDEIVEEDEPPYNFEITSLGAEKPLTIEKLPFYIDKYVEVRMNNPIEGENIYQGFLKEVNDDDIVIIIQIKARKKDIRINKSNISKIRLAIKF